MFKKSLYKHIEFYMHKNFFPCIKWNTIQVFSNSTQLYQQCPTYIGTKYMLLCEIINNLFVVIVILLH